MTSRKKPGVAFWATVVVVCLPLLYVASFGPVCALAEHDALPLSVMTTGFFKPCFALIANGPKPICTITFAWVEFCGGGYALAEAIARREFEESPYFGVSGGLFR